MKEKIKYIMEKKSFHICMIIIIITVILCTLGLIVLRYNVEGETNMPFELTKITVISSSEGVDKESGENRWAFDVNQNNDIYLYIERNENYTKQEAIKSIVIDNIQIEKEIEKGTVNIYKPDSTEGGRSFSNNEENISQVIEYTGALESDIKNLKISNQGGLIVFRYANDKISEYISNDEVINHSELLKKSNITEEDIKAKISFDLTIEIESGKEYKANICLDMPIQGVVEQGTTSTEMTDLKDIIFKRTKN